jgi:histidyl-tRNA synthetase
LTTKPPSGTRDFLPADVRRREHVIDVIRRVYERYGFEPLETPAFENIETLLGKYGEEGNKLIFKILRRGEHEASGEADLALRYDLTVPLARVIAQYQNELPKFFKRYQIQPVWRADRPARGRFREFYQCDIDAIGSTSLTVETELLAAVSDVLSELGFTDFVIRLNNRRLLAALMAGCAIPPDRQGEVLVAIDKLDKIGPEGVERELKARGVEADSITPLLHLFGDVSLKDARSHSVALTRVREFVRENAQGAEALDTLDEIVHLTENTASAGRIRIDPSLARGLSYYTGAIMEIAVPDLAGSLGGGGRYDNLVGMFLGRDVAACGFSLGLERIIVVMTERGMFPETLGRGAVDVMVALWNDESRADALALAGDLRRGALRVEVYPDADKAGKQFKYASTRGFPFVALVGDDERAAGTVAIKNMSTGAQETVPRADAPNHIQRQLSTEKDAQ